MEPIVLEPTDAGYWPEVDCQLTMTLDDLLVERGHIVPFHRSGRPSRRWGRYGNELLIQGDTASPVRRRWETSTACGDREGASSYACPMHP
jgi:hypothetical protein